MRFDVVTLFPEMFPGYLGQSILHRAIKNALVEVYLHNLRDWSKNVHHAVDDRPFGGGPGMVIMVEPTVDCVESVRKMDGDAGHLIALTPSGRRLDQPLVEELSGHQRLVLLCGRYEGFDQRVFDLLQPQEVSVGDFVLNGGEVAAMVLIDTLVRLVPGVLGDERSNKQDSFSGEQRFLEHPHYTRPREFRGLNAPDVLLSGNHQQIARWRQEQSLLRTHGRRPDLLPETVSDLESNVDSDNVRIEE